MKNWLYIPFLVLMAITYTRLSENFEEGSIKVNSRGPASIEIIIEKEDCIDLPAKFNPHTISKSCF